MYDHIHQRTEMEMTQIIIYYLQCVWLNSPRTTNVDDTWISSLIMQASSVSLSTWGKFQFVPNWNNVQTLTVALRLWSRLQGHWPWSMMSFERIKICNDSSSLKVDNRPWDRTETLCIRSFKYRGIRSWNVSTWKSGLTCLSVWPLLRHMTFNTQSYTWALI